MDTESVFNAIAAVLKPKAFKVSMEGIWPGIFGKNGPWDLEYSSHAHTGGAAV